MRVERAGTITSAGEITHHHGIDARIEPLDAADVVVEQLKTGDGATEGQLCEAPSRQKRWIHDPVPPV
jgi:hypothetical protein